VQTSDRPNVLQIICHDIGQHVGCLGAGLETPNIDALAAEGVLFDTYCCSAAQCSPSRGSIMTGRYPHNNGLVGLAHIGWELNEDERCLPHYLNDFGYQTHLFGLQHESARSERLGYQNIHKCGNRAAQVGPAVAEWLKEYSSGRGGTPFYLNAGIAEPHRPYEAEGYQGDDPEEVTLLPWLPDRPGIRADIADLNGLMYAVDDAVGAISGALEETGLENDTLLIFTTDHGLAMPRAKGTCYDPGLKTVLMMRLPGRYEGGRRESALLTNCDFLPTILEFVGAPAVANVEGRSFLGLLDRTAYEPNQFIYSEMTWHDKYNPMRSIRTEDYKYIRNFGERPLVYLPLDVWRGRAGQEMRDEYYGSPRPEEELYDLKADPLEYNNLVGDPKYAQVLEDLRGRVQRWMEETDDPLLHGDVPPTPKQAERLATSDESN